MCRVLKVQKSSWHAEIGQEACLTFHHALVLACKDKLGAASGYFGNWIARVHAAVIGMPWTFPWSSLPCRYYRLITEYGSHQSLPPSPSHLHTVTWLTNPQGSSNSDYLGRAELFSVPPILFPPGVITRAIKTIQLPPSIISWENRSQNRLYIFCYLNCSSGWPQSTLIQSPCVSFPKPANPGPSFFCVITGYYCKVILWGFNFQVYQLSDLGQDLQ